MDIEIMALMEKLFNTAYLIAKQDYAFDDFPNLCALQKKNGLKIGDTYMNNNSAKLFVKYIADSMRIELKQELSETDFISLMADGSTDRSVTASEAIYLRYLYKSESKCTFVALKECESENAEGILSAITLVLDDFVPDWQKKLIAVGFDGASVNMGNIAGVAKLLDSKCNGITSVHCIAHRLELAVSDALKNIKYVTLAEEILKGVYSYYHNSPKRTKELQHIGELLEEKILSHVGLHGIRWLQSRHRAIKVLLNNLFPVVVHMEETASTERDRYTSAKVKGYLKSLKSERLIKFLFLMEDVTNCLARLSEVFQRKYVDINEIRCNLLLTTEKLQKMISQSGVGLEQFEKELKMEGLQVIYKGITLTRNVSELSAFEEDRRVFLQKLIESIKKRYDSIENSDVLGNLHIFDPCNVVNLSEKGNEEIDAKFQKLVKALPSNLDIEKTEATEEFQNFKMWAKDKINIPCHSAWVRLMAESLSCSTFINIRKILHFIMLLPMSTAECERGFSHLNLIKTKTRIRLSSSSVNDLLFIKLHGPDMIEYNPQAAINLWWKDVAYGRVRRPDFKD